jgi:hypothetical protein
MEFAMPFMLRAIYSHWWKFALKARKPTSVIVLTPEENAPEFAVTTSAPEAYQG